KMGQKIKEYWDERAKQYSGVPAATTNDVYLRELEISTIVQTLHEIQIPCDGSALDVGCGDGYSTLKVAQATSGLRFLGIDYSENMIKNACERFETHPELKARVAFVIGDVMELRKACGDSAYDVVLSDRCLINLDSIESQRYAMAQIAEHTKPGGYYIAIENFIEGHENMNRARHAVGVPEIPVRWHNLYFKEHEFIRSAERFFEDIVFKDFSSSYYFATRVVYSAMCHMRGEEPDYNHEIHQLSIRLPWIGQFSPIRMALLRKKLR
ncbi:MAG: class I SAM-dependent methyltransferase, partial [Dehalococcoidia bacterium]|nr:class I SAM-dependent methyltransferase [Dehalococcoidia bacterium]